MIPFRQTHRRCQCCGQVIYGEIPDDPVKETILHILDHANGSYIRTRIIQDMVGMEVSRWTIHRRLAILEEDGEVERHPSHPKSGWRKVRQKADKIAA